MNKRISNELCEELFISELNVELNFTHESFNKLLELYSVSKSINNIIEMLKIFKML